MPKVNDSPCSVGETRIWPDVDAVLSGTYLNIVEKLVEKSTFFLFYQKSSLLADIFGSYTIFVLQGC